MSDKVVEMEGVKDITPVEKKENPFTGFVKKHWKKIAIGTAITAAVVGTLAYMSKDPEVVEGDLVPIEELEDAD